MVNETQHASPVDNGPTHRSWHRLDIAGKAGVISAWLTAVSAVIALLAWWLPQTPPEVPMDVDRNPAAPQGGPTPTPVMTTEPASVPSNGVTTVSYLDGMTPQAAGSNIVTLPRALRGSADYSSHPLVIHCPSNETGDDTSNVTYLLGGRYLRLDMTVRPYYPPDADQRSVTFVLADVGVREIDAEMTTRQVGAQKRATPSAPGQLTADVEGAQELTLKIACDDPRGLVVLTEARLTIAG